MVESSNTRPKCPRPTPIEQVLFLECDIQSKVGSKIFRYNTVVHQSAKLGKLSNILGIPLVATQQVNFGPIDQLCLDSHNETLTKVFEKNAFSMTGDEATMNHIKSLKRSIAVLYGTVTEACILQTSKGLLDAGYTVFLVVDAVSSFQVEERNTGLQMLRDLGVTLTTF